MYVQAKGSAGAQGHPADMMGVADEGDGDRADRWLRYDNRHRV